MASSSRPAFAAMSFCELASIVSILALQHPATTREPIEKLLEKCWEDLDQWSIMALRDFLHDWNQADIGTAYDLRERARGKAQEVRKIVSAWQAKRGRRPVREDSGDSRTLFDDNTGSAGSTPPFSRGRPARLYVYDAGEHHEHRREISGTLWSMGETGGGNFRFNKSTVDIMRTVENPRKLVLALHLAFELTGLLPRGEGFPFITTSANSFTIPLGRGARVEFRPGENLNNAEVFQYIRTLEADPSQWAQLPVFIRIAD